MKITKDTKLAELLQFPEAVKVLTKHGLPCVTCPMLAREAEMLKIGEVARMYGVKLENLLKELNKISKAKK